MKKALSIILAGTMAASTMAIGQQMMKVAMFQVAM